MAQHTDAEIEARLFQQIRKHDFGMLGLMGGEGGYPQPMTAYCDEGETTLWFYSRRDTDLARAVEASASQGLFVYVDKNREIFASMGGELTATRDQQRIDKFWNPVAAAWYPNGKDDPELTMLRFDPRQAEVWLSEKGPVKFGWEIAKANASKQEPDVGERASLQL